MSKCNEIAIVGVACRFPGAKNKYEFWNNLVNGVDSVNLVPNEGGTQKNIFQRTLWSRIRLTVNGWEHLMV